MKIQYFALSDEYSSELLSLEIYFHRLDSKVIFIFFFLILVQEAKTAREIGWITWFLFSDQIKQIFSYAETNFFLQVNPSNILQNVPSYGTLGNEWTITAHLLTAQKYCSTSFIKSSKILRANNSDKAGIFRLAALLLKMRSWSRKRRKSKAPSYRCLFVITEK